MNIFSKKKILEKEHAILWKKEAERLKKERNNLLIKLNSLEQYKEVYENLSKEIPTTSLPSGAMIHQVFDQIKKDGFPGRE